MYAAQRPGGSHPTHLREGVTHTRHVTQMCTANREQSLHAQGDPAVSGIYYLTLALLPTE